MGVECCAGIRLGGSSLSLSPRPETSSTSMSMRAVVLKLKHPTPNAQHANSSIERYLELREMVSVLGTVDRRGARLQDLGRHVVPVVGFVFVVGRVMVVVFECSVFDHRSHMYVP